MPTPQIRELAHAIDNQVDSLERLLRYEKSPEARERIFNQSMSMAMDSPALQQKAQAVVKGLLEQEIEKHQEEQQQTFNTIPLLSVANVGAYLFTGQKRHLNGPDAIMLSLTANVLSGVNAGFEKGYIIVIEKGNVRAFDVNGIEVGFGALMSITGTVKVMLLYSSSEMAIKRDFYGTYTEGNLSVSAYSASVGGSAVYSGHDKDNGFTVGFGFTVGLDLIPFDAAFSINKGAATEKISDLSKESKRMFKKR